MKGTLVTGRPSLQVIAPAGHFHVNGAHLPRVLPESGVGHYLRDLVYGALDGGVTTLAIVAGASGADLGARVAIILGLANLVGDGVSMAAGNYLGMRSEIQQQGKDPDVAKPLRHGLATFAAFAVVGSVPLLSYLVPVGQPLWAAGVLTGATLFVVGSLRARFVPGQRAWKLGLEMVAIAAVAALAALGVGVAAGRLM